MTTLAARLAPWKNAWESASKFKTIPRKNWLYESNHQGFLR